MTKGETLKKEDILLSRPGYGIYSKDVQSLIGKHLNSDVKEASLVPKALFNEVK